MFEFLGLRWFRLSALAIVTVTVLALAIVAAVDHRVTSDAAERDAARYVPPTTSIQVQRTAVFIGDSYTQGNNATDVSKQFVSIVAGSENWLQVNLGRGGTGYLATSNQQGCGRDFCPNYDAMLDDAVKAKPDIVIVSGGRNDATVPAAREKTAVNKFFSDLRKALPNVKVYVTSPIWDSTPAPAALSQIQDSVRSAAKAADATYLDLKMPLRGHPELISSDDVHPNDNGHAVIANAIVAAIKSAS